MSSLSTRIGVVSEDRSIVWRPSQLMTEARSRPPITGNMGDHPDRSTPPICADMGGSVVGVRYGDSDFSLDVSLSEMRESFRDLTQPVGSVDNRCHLPGFHKIP